MTRCPGRGAYGFDDVDEGNVINAGSACILAATIDKFADLTGDRFEIHMSAEATARRGFGCRVAHGLLVQSLVDGLKNRAPVQFPAQASFGWNWSFREAVITGDTISVEIRVAEKRESRDPKRGILRLEFNVTNQRGECVQRGENLLMVYR